MSHSVSAIDWNSLPHELRQLPGDTPEAEDRFHESLLQILKAEQGVKKSWKIGGVLLHLAKLFKAVVHRNGSGLVSKHRKWKDVANSLGINNKSASTTIRKIYEQHLQPLEDRICNFPDVEPSKKKASMPSASGAGGKAPHIQGPAVNREQSTARLQSANPLNSAASPVSQQLRLHGGSTTSPFPSGPPGLPIETAGDMAVTSAAQYLTTSAAAQANGALPSSSAVTAVAPAAVRHASAELQQQDGSAPTPKGALAAVQNAMQRVLEGPQLHPGSTVQAAASAKRKRLTKAEEAALQKELIRKQIEDGQQHIQQQKLDTERKQQHDKESAIQREVQEQMVPTLGPFVSMPTRLTQQQVALLPLALESGYPPQVNWALNMLTVLSFEEAPAFLLEEHPGVLEALLKVISRGGCGSKGDYCLIESGSQEEGGMASSSVARGDDDYHQLLLDRVSSHHAAGTSWRSNRWRGQGEALAPPPGELDEFTWAVCGTNVLRNVACISPNQGVIAAASCVDTLTTCLEATQQLEGPGGNEYRANIMETLLLCTHRIKLDELRLGGMALLDLVKSTMTPWMAPLHLQAAAAGVLHALLRNDSASCWQHQITQQWRSELLDHLLLLLTAQRSTARQAVQSEVDVGTGRHHMRYLKGNKNEGMAVEAMAAVVHADAVQAASQLYVQLAMQGKQEWQPEIASHRPTLNALVQLVRGILPLDTGLADHNKSLFRYTQDMFAQARSDAATVLQHLATHPAARDKLTPFEGKLAVAAMNGVPEAKGIAQILGAMMHDRAGNSNRTK